MLGLCVFLFAVLEDTGSRVRSSVKLSEGSGTDFADLCLGSSYASKSLLSSFGFFERSDLVTIAFDYFLRDELCYPISVFDLIVLVAHVG